MSIAIDIDFSHYYLYEEIVKYLQEIAAKYPHLIELKTIGQSYEGREIILAILTNQDKGNYLNKPGFWIDANTHAGEVTGSTVALYCIAYLMEGYQQKDGQVTMLLDNYTIYILPRIAVDGAEKYLTTPYKLRSSTRIYPHAESQDGLRPEDINGDSLILQMRIQDDCGAWKISEEDPRLMLPREPSEFGGTYYTILPEGLINNYDGYSIELASTLEGMDFNRNYPHLWKPEAEQKGAGDFPFSEPETRAEAEFWRQNRNINGFITYHTYSAVILRPYSTHPDEYFPQEDLEMYKFIASKAKEITGYECVSVYHDFRYDPHQVTCGAMDDYGYDQWGWFGYTVELWDAPTEAGIKKQDYVQWFRWHSPEDSLKLLKWNDEKLGGSGFIDWQPFFHPQLGEVEIGGWNEKAVWQNAPSQYLPDLCAKQCQFALTQALMSPRLAITRTDITAEGENIYKLVVQIENQGFLPTYTSKKALEREAVRPIMVILSLPNDATLISGKLEQEIGHLEGRSNKTFTKIAKGNDYRSHISWIVKIQRVSEVEVTVKAERAGTLIQKVKFIGLLDREGTGNREYL